MHDRRTEMQTQTRQDHTVREDYESLREDLAALRQDVASLTRSLVAAGHDGVRKLDANVRQSAAALREQASEQVGHVRERIEEKPLMAVSGAFAAGVIAGALVHRLRSTRSAA